MGPILDSLKVNHAVDARKCSSLAAIAVRIEFLFGQDVTTRLFIRVQVELAVIQKRHTQGENTSE